MEPISQNKDNNFSKFTKYYFVSKHTK